MSAAPNLLNLVWTVIGFFIGAMQIIASILLLRERNAAPWLMLIGSVISILGHAATRVFLMLLDNRGGGGFAGRLPRRRDGDPATAHPGERAGLEPSK